VASYTHPGEENPLIEYHPLASEELLICTCRDHPLAEKALPNGHSPYPRLELKMLKKLKMVSKSSLNQLIL
jgi:DNA-binding transcriptional LysR family regulator